MLFASSYRLGWRHCSRQLRLAACLLAVVAALLATARETRAAFITIDPSETYLDLPSNSGNPATPVDLSLLGIFPGDTVHLQEVGDWSYFSSGFNETLTGVVGVFSSSNVLLPFTSGGNSARVPGALSTSLPQVNWPFVGGDIPEDFYLDSVVDGTTVVPPGAAYLFFTGYGDNVYGDNTDTNNDFGVVITRVPEPGSVGLLTIGVLAFGGRWLRRRRRFS